jgi:hypothetical protein
MEDYKVVKKIEMTTEQLKGLLEVARKYKYYYVYDSEQNRDGQGEWHCDVFLDNEAELGADGWGDGEEYWSFNEVKQIPITQVKEYCIERDLPQLKTVGDLKRYAKTTTDKIRLFMRNGKLWLRQTSK